MAVSISLFIGTIIGSFGMLLFLMFTGDAK